jgi:uncharacterized cupredoxin-like copper-binding protein
MIAAAVLLAAGCGSTNTTGGAAPTTTGGSLQPKGAKGGRASTTLQIQAPTTGALRFSAKVLKAPAGKVTLVLTNPSSVEHNVAIRGHGVNTKGDVVKDGAKSTVVADVQAGYQYEFYCSVDGHADAGMRGFINVGTASNPG